MIQFDEHIFQVGWNHQLDTSFFYPAKFSGRHFWNSQVDQIDRNKSRKLPEYPNLVDLFKKEKHLPWDSKSTIIFPMFSCFNNIILLRIVT